MAHTIDELRERQALPLELKIRLTESRIRGWVNEYGEDGVYISFSGGKDSTVLMDIIRNRMGYKNIPAVFVNVPTQFPELKQFAMTWDNVTIINPKISFMQVCEQYGFPLISKETAECVAGARKYLKCYKEEVESSQKEKKKNLPYHYFYEIVTGTGKYQVRENTPNGESVIDNIDFEDLVSKMHENKYKKNGSVARLANILGMNTRDNNYTAKEEISKDNKSKYSQEKWKFFLDAPFEINSKCCNVMKKDPAHQYSKETGRHPITAEMADESRLRTQQWLKNGCNGFQMKSPKSTPMSFWTENDVLKYIHDNNLPICSVYGDVVIDYDTMGHLEGQMTFDEFDQDIKYRTTGCNRTGCCLCAFGAHLESQEDARFLMLKETHPKMYNLLDIIKNNGITYREAIEWTNEHLRDSQKIPL